MFEKLVNFGYERSDYDDFDNDFLENLLNEEEEYVAKKREATEKKEERKREEAKKMEADELVLANEQDALCRKAGWFG